MQHTHASPVFSRLENACLAKDATGYQLAVSALTAAELRHQRTLATNPASKTQLCFSALLPVLQTDDVAFCQKATHAFLRVWTTAFRESIRQEVIDHHVFWGFQLQLPNLQKYFFRRASLSSSWFPALMSASFQAPLEATHSQEAYCRIVSNFAAAAEALDWSTPRGSAFAETIFQHPLVANEMLRYLLPAAVRQRFSLESMFGEQAQQAAEHVFQSFKKKKKAAESYDATTLLKVVSVSESISALEKFLVDPEFYQLPERDGVTPAKLALIRKIVDACVEKAPTVSEKQHEFAKLNCSAFLKAVSACRSVEMLNWYLEKYEELDLARDVPFAVLRASMVRDSQVKVHQPKKPPLFTQQLLRRTTCWTEAALLREMRRIFWHIAGLKKLPEFQFGAEYSYATELGELMQSHGIELATQIPDEEYQRYLRLSTEPAARSLLLSLFPPEYVCSRPFPEALKDVYIQSLPMHDRHAKYLFAKPDIRLSDAQLRSLFQAALTTQDHAFLETIATTAASSLVELFSDSALILLSTAISSKNVYGLRKLLFDWIPIAGLESLCRQAADLKMLFKESYSLMLFSFFLRNFSTDLSDEIRTLADTPARLYSDAQRRQLAVAFQNAPAFDGHILLAAKRLLGAELSTEWPAICRSHFLQTSLQNGFFTTASQLRHAIEAPRSSRHAHSKL